MTKVDHAQKIKDFYSKCGRMPSYSEICRLFGYASKQAAYRLAEKLIKNGTVKKDVTGRLIPNFSKLKLSLMGYVQAGFPSPAEEELVDTLTLEDYLISKPQASFLLKVTGDSMIEAGIMPGDLVIVERGQTPKNGDIVLAHIDREWTLKYFQKKNGQVLLIPANPKYPTLKAQESLEIAGVVTSSVRKYK